MCNVFVGVDVLLVLCLDELVGLFGYIVVDEV